MNNQEHVCEKCGEHYSLRNECEPTSLCDLCCQTEFESMNRQLAAEKARADKAEAACAEMREAIYEISIQECIGVEHLGVCCIEESSIHSIAEEALAKTDCGTGWLSPEKARRAIEALEYAIANPDDCLGTLERIEKALAALKSDTL